MGEDVRFEVGRLSELLAARVERTHVWPVASVNAYMSSQVEVQRETLPTPLECTLHTDTLLLFLTLSINTAECKPHVLKHKKAANAINASN